MVRSTHLARLRGGAFDVLVIGGGVTGARVGLQAALPLGMSLGLWTYDVLAGRRGGRRHRRLDTAAATALVPALRVDGLRRAFLYYDGLTDDARLTLTVLRTAAKRGAVVANYVEAVGVTAEAGRITGASLVDRRTGERFAVRA